MIVLCSLLGRLAVASSPSKNRQSRSGSFLNRITPALDTKGVFGSCLSARQFFRRWVTAVLGTRIRIEPLNDCHVPQEVRYFERKCTLVCQSLDWRFARDGKGTFSPGSSFPGESSVWRARQFSPGADREN
jgi:hypothetical protein